MSHSIRRLFLLFSVVFIFAQSVIANPLEYYYQRKQARLQGLSAPSSSGMEQGLFQAWIDNHHHELGTFNQRFYIDSTFAKDDQAPVFFYICGEATCHATALYGAIRHYAQRFGARLVALEHRYYGYSQPYATLTTEHLKYLSTEQALSDLAHFQSWLIQNRGYHGKWVAFGGSYPGSLSAYYRLKYPSLVVGSLASSAPVQAKSDFYEYDRHVAKVAGPSCLNHIQQAVSSVEAILDQPQMLAKVKGEFHASDIKAPVDFLVFMAEVAAASVQYGDRDTFCRLLDKGETPLDGYARAAQHVLSTWGIHASELVAQGGESLDPNDYINNFGMRQWLYQSCTEYGYWQNANADRSQSARSVMMNAAYHRDVCHRLFGLTHEVDTNGINQNYYLPLFDLSVSHILFTNGSDDPWSNLSLASRNDNTDNPNLDYYLIENAAHCDDLRRPQPSDSTSLKQAREKTIELITQWLS